MSTPDNPMSPEELERYVEQHSAELLDKAQRQALNHLATERAIELAAQSTKPKGPANMGRK
jgi:hypothetical protein